MASDSKNTQNQSNPLGFVINEKGEEVPITEEMVAQSMSEVKLHSIGAHTGYHQVLTDEMIKKIMK